MMVRGIAMLVSALAAASAQAQDARTSRGEEKVVEQPRIVLASTTPIESRGALPPHGAPITQPIIVPRIGASSVQVAAPASDDCSVVELLLGDAPLETRIYKQSPLTPVTPKDRSWDKPPAVKSATRCGGKYILQVKSKSTEPWVIKAARLEGPNEALLKVHDVQSRVLKSWSINIIVAEAPPGVGPDYPLLSLHLVGEDGRVAALDGVVLP